MGEKRERKSANRRKLGKKEASKRTYSAKEVVEAWINFKSKMPLSYTLAVLKAAREK